MSAAASNRSAAVGRRAAKGATPERGRYADVVYARVKSAIVTGSIASGERLREEEVGARYGVSRTPVREAFQRLETDGLLERDSSGVLAVSATTPRDIVEIYLLREVLEGVAARLAAERATETDLLGLELCVNRTDEVMRQGAYDKALALSNQFHAVVWQMANNRQLTKIMDELNVALQRFARLVARYPENIKGTFGDHRALLDAIRRRDGRVAEEVAREHMRRVRDLRVDLILREIESPPHGVDSVAGSH